jgi:CheY-like chemotaxis protein
MHGEVEVASEPGVGSSFSFTAQFGITSAMQSAQPAIVDRVPAIAPLPTSSATLNRPLNILIVDDSYDNRALIEAYLKKTPYRLEVAEDGQQAIDKFIAGRFDLVLMDIQMPIVDGYEATTKIRGWERDHGRRRTPVVALTASALEDASDRTMAAGCDAHVTKPVKKSTLLNAIRDAVEGKLPRGNTSNDERADSNNL